MSNRRKRRRFYPEFYTDEELKNNERSIQTESNEVKEEVNEVAEEPQEVAKMEEMEENQESAISQTDENDEDFVENIFDRTKKPEIPMLEENPVDVEEVGENENELSIEIPQDMYIRNMPVMQQMNFDNEEEFDNTSTLFESPIEDFPVNELSIQDNKEIHKIFETVSDKSYEPENDLPLSVPTFAEFHEEKTEPVKEREIEFIPENIFPTENISSPNIIPFDRDKAIEYAHRWALDRNPRYYDFEDIGGDCTNYVSQVLLAGLGKMDKSSVVYGWYYNNANDKSPSWTGVEQFYDYLIREKDYGIIAHEIDLNEVKSGDIAQISFNGKTFQHTPFIISVKRNSDDSVSHDHIKICAHSFDSENRSLDSYQWKKIRFIRVVGFKE